MFSITRKSFLIFREQDYEYDKVKSGVKFRNSGITLHIFDAAKSEMEAITTMEDTRKLFDFRMNEIWTAALFYRDDKLHKIKENQIGGVEYVLDCRKRVEYVCSLPLKFGDGEPIYRIITTSKEIKATLNQLQTGHGVYKERVTWTLRRSGRPGIA